MKKHSKIVTVEYVVQDCPICGKVIVKHYLDNTSDIKKGILNSRKFRG
uniref:Uncharacterized protein n=1 Tax=Myoviridae sp. ctcPl3 TaxID=2826669 RepID=A0A8S5QWG1_9CAUD|nr:MAG TPA: hypothetical protein [Myoviridae sp. ctcPl3]